MKFSLRGKAQTFRLHSNLGLYLIIPLLISCATGLVWIFPKYEKAVYRLISPDYKKEKQKMNLFTGDFQLMSLDKLKESVDSLNPKKMSLNMFFIPQKTNSPIRVLSCINDDRFGFTNNYYAQPETGEILNTVLDADRSGAEKLRSLNYDIHTGSIGRIYGKLIIFILGILGASLPVSGYILFFKRK